MFINYQSGQLTTSPERNPAGYANSCIEGLVEDMLNDSHDSSAPLAGAMRALAADTWADDDATQSVLEQLRAVVECVE